MLQIIAMITMLVDHVGLIFFPDTSLFRIVGRIAFPLYSWFLVQGYLHTRNHKKYMQRLFWLACASQIPYSLALQQLEFNVIFTLLLSLIALYALDHLTPALKIIVISGVFSSAILVPMDYGLYGILLIFILRYFNQWGMIGCHMLLNLMFSLIYGPGYWIQLFSIFGTVLIANAYPIPYRSVVIGKWLYRSFYPAHLAILYLISFWVEHFDIQ
ncbi:TraX family protein [Cohnella luojiensis]|uniref:Conjugal transfer protein TraX n=1 Tax=Cohnella luojiensis TaxID=652876 RepID=A0A4Y8M381_9BACL|nr:TraX family protein [Cohnella luojiensis]TFE28656.1 conjugal transfer protein TraX [Cohnella luojiensis]